MGFSKTLVPKAREPAEISNPKGGITKGENQGKKGGYNNLEKN